MLVAVGALALMDAGLKALSPHYPALQLASIRGLSAMPFVVAWVYFSGGFMQLLRVRFRLHLLRGALGIGMLALFTYAVRHLPLSEAYTIFFVAPLMITAFAALLLRERVDRSRWLAIAAGFAGVVIALRPSGAGFLSLPGLAVLLTASGYAISAITVRVLGRTDTTPAMVFWVMAIVAVGAGLLALPSWRPVAPAHWPWILEIAVTGSLGQWAITEAFKRGESSFIAPFEYTALAWGVLLDWLLWRTLPPPVTFVGAAIVIASGLYLFRRERATTALAPDEPLRTAV